MLFISVSPQVEYGQLKGCFISRATGVKYCIIQLFESVMCAGQGDENVIKNEVECPLLFQLKLFGILQSNTIQHTVSLVQECTSACTLKKTSIYRTVEREDITQTSTLAYCHDWTNNLFCLNVYKME